MIYSTPMERKQKTHPLNHKASAQPRSEVKPREVTKPNKHYSFQQTSKIYHPLATKLFRKTVLRSTPKQ